MIVRKKKENIFNFPKRKHARNGNYSLNFLSYCSTFFNIIQIPQGNEYGNALQTVEIPSYYVVVHIR